MMQMAYTIKYLDRDVRIALQYIAQVRNRFCHQSPWFTSEVEKRRFTEEVQFLAEKFQLHHWRGGAIGARMLQIQWQQQQEIQRQQTAQAAIPASSFAPSSMPPPTFVAKAAPPPPPPIQQAAVGYEVPLNDDDVRRKVEEAQVFVASQRLAVSESQRMEDEEEDEDDADGEDDQSEWPCPFCGFHNQIEDLICTVCADGVPPDRWKCPLCTHVNFSVEDQCVVCETSKPKPVAPQADPNADRHEAKNDDDIVVIVDDELPQSQKKRQRMTSYNAEVPSVARDVEEDEVELVEPDICESGGSTVGNRGDMPSLVILASSSASGGVNDPTRSNEKESVHSPDLQRRTVETISQGTDDSALPGWVLDRVTLDNKRIYRNETSGKIFDVEWPLPAGWRLAVSSSKPTERLCFVCKDRKQSVYPPRDCPEGWILLHEGKQRRTYEKVGSAMVDGEPVLFHTPWPLPEGWILALSKSRPNQLCYLKVSDGTKMLKFPNQG